MSSSLILSSDADSLVRDIFRCDARRCRSGYLRWHRYVVYYQHRANSKVGGERQSENADFSFNANIFRPHFAILTRIDALDVDLLSEEYRHIRILRFDESLYAGNAPFFKRKFYELIGLRNRMDAPEQSYRYIVLELSSCNYIDTVGVKVLVQVCENEARVSLMPYS